MTPARTGMSNRSRGGNTGGTAHPPAASPTSPSAPHTTMLDGGAFFLPNRLVDTVLPTLKDTELRVLLIVIRQTWGWRDPHGRTKARDWLSHRQLVRRTGRGSEAVSGAIAALVERELIAVEDSTGHVLATAAERRRHLGRLYFRPGQRCSCDDHCSAQAPGNSSSASRPVRSGYAARPVSPPQPLEPVSVTSGWSRAVRTPREPAT